MFFNFLQYSNANLPLCCGHKSSTKIISYFILIFFNKLKVWSIILLTLYESLYSGIIILNELIIFFLYFINISLKISFGA